MTGNIKNYYEDAHTALGYYNLFDSAINNLDKVFVLKGGPGTGKSTLMKAIGEKWIEKGLDVEYIHCAYDGSLIDGVIVRTLKLGVFDGSIPNFTEEVPGKEYEYFDLSKALDLAKLYEHKKEIDDMTSNIKEEFELAHSCFNTALKIHDEWERIYLDNIDFNKLNILTDKFNELLIGEKVLNKKSAVNHRFFGAPTPGGSVDFINDLTSDISKRYFIKGRPGSGKSTFLKKMAAQAERRGIDVEVYHCAFDPNSIDMLIMRELDVALFDSTSPHEYFPVLESDEVIDTYKESITPGTDEKYAAELDDIIGRYNSKKKEALSHLAKAINKQNTLKKIYTETMDFSKLEGIKEEINNRIESLVTK